MGKTWVLDTETKGTGANVVPLEKMERKPDHRPGLARTPAERKAVSTDANVAAANRRRAPRSSHGGQTARTPLPAAHVRKKTTGEIGRVQSVDGKAGTATVHWLKRGDTSTVPLSAISRR